MIKNIVKQIAKFEKNIKFDFDLKNENSFGVCGKCALFVQPKNIKNLVKIIKICVKEKIKYFVLGFGTNVLVLKQGYSGVVISTKKIDKMQCKNNKIIAQCGVNLFKLNDFAVKNCLSGLEFSYGIPGGVGGALSMNAGAFGKEMKNVVDRVWAFNGKKIIKYENNECKFGYRTSIFQNNLIVLQVEFCLNKAKQEDIIKSNIEYIRLKKQRQPYGEKSAGSFFKRCGDVIVSKLIDEMGFKGKKVGDAMVSDVHAGFIVNIGNATSDEILKLAEIIFKKVAKTHQIDLQLEVRLLGDLDENFWRLPHSHAL